MTNAHSGCRGTIRTVRVASDVLRFLSAVGRSHAKLAAENLFLKTQLVLYVEPHRSIAIGRLRMAVYRDYNVITMTAKTRIVRIGNSRGIRIPKTLLEEAELPDEVELHAEPGRLVVEGVRHARKGWAAAAQRMRSRSDDRLLDEPTTTKFDREEWEWR